MKQIIKRQYYKGERALYHTEDAELIDCVFLDGESPLKESHNLQIENSLFHYRYPLWYCSNIHVQNSTFFEPARAGVWYTNDATFEHCTVDSPKTFRRCKGLTFKDVTISNAQETLWACEDVSIDQMTVRGEYFAMNSQNVTIDHLSLVGKYSFDGCKNLTIRNSRLITKDAFWNCENVTIYDSFISAEYIAWNSQNIYFDNCTLESLQGLCYTKSIKLKNCKLLNTSLAFEYSTVDADIVGPIDSVVNPESGVIVSDGIEELILQDAYIDPTKTEIKTRN